MPQSKKSVTKSKPRQETEKVEDQQPMGGGQAKEPLTKTVIDEEQVKDKIMSKEKKSVKSMVKKAVTKVKNALSTDVKVTEQISVKAVANEGVLSLQSQVSNLASVQDVVNMSIPNEEKVINKSKDETSFYTSFKKALDDHNDEVTKLRNTRVTHVINHLDSVIKPSIINELTTVIKDEILEQNMSLCKALSSKLDAIVQQMNTLKDNKSDAVAEPEIISNETTNDAVDDEKVELPTQDEDEALMWEAALHYAKEQPKEERLRMLSNFTIGQSALQDVFMQIGDSMSEESNEQIETIEGEVTAAEISAPNTVSSIVNSIENPPTPADDAIRGCFGDMNYVYNKETSFLLVEDKKIFFKVSEDDLLLSFICKSTPKKCVKDIGELLVEFANGRECTGCSYQSAPESDDWEILKRVSGRLSDYIGNVTTFSV